MWAGVWDLDFASFGWGGVVILAVISVLRGWLVPRKTLTDCQHERDDWKKAALAKDDTINTMAHQLDEAQEASRVATATMQALSRAVKR